MTKGFKSSLGSSLMLIGVTLSEYDKNKLGFTMARYLEQQVRTLIGIMASIQGNSFQVTVPL